MKKKMLLIVAAIALMIYVPSVSAATIEVTDDASLVDAFKKAVTGDTIKLTKDVTHDGSYIMVDEGRTLTFDLNGFNLTTVEKKENRSITVSNGNLTVTGKGTITMPGHNALAVWGSKDKDAKDYSVLTVEKDVTLVGKYGVAIFENQTKINKDAYLYRIRKNISSTEKDPWGIYKNNKSFGRFDKNNPILYVSENDGFLEQETHLNINDDYCLGKYTVTKDFVVGRPILPNDDFQNVSFFLHKICQAINKKHLSQEDVSKLCNIKTENILDNPILRSLKLGIEFGDKIYEYTNWIGEQILNVFKNGIAYSSSFNPIDTCMGNCTIVLDDNLFNIALTESGCKNIRLVGYQNKIAKNTIDLSALINTYYQAIKKK